MTPADHTPKYLGHPKVGVHVNGRNIPFHRYIAAIERRAEWRGFWHGAAWVLIFAFLGFGAIWMNLPWYFLAWSL